jgi:hypothetical protein
MLTNRLQFAALTVDAETRIMLFYFEVADSGY